MVCICKNEKYIIENCKCANKDCCFFFNNVLTDPIDIKNACPEHSMLICGGGDALCENCTKDGYTVYSGIGDGLIHLVHKGKTVSYSYEEAYKLQREFENKIANDESYRF